MPFPEPAAALMDLTGKVAVVTGGGSGIGRAICLRLAGAGASVVVADIDSGGAGVTVKLIEDAGGRAVPTVTDVRIPDDAAALAQLAVHTYGGLDILVNNAGLYPHSPVLDTSEEFWDRVQDVNVKGTF